MKWMVLAALAACLGMLALIGNTLHLATGVHRFSDERASTAGVPALVNADAVPVTDGVAVFDVRCDNETGCDGTVTIDLKGKVGVGEYRVGPGETQRVGVLLPLDSAARRGTLTWREASGATADISFRLQRA